MSAQAEADIWVLGYNTEKVDPDFGIMFFDFTSNELNITYDLNNFLWHIEGVNASICDSSGKLSLLTNGSKLFDFNNPMWFDTICYGAYWSSWGELGFPRYQGALILPVPLKSNEYSVIYSQYHDVGFYEPIGLLETRLKVNVSDTPEILYSDKKIGSIKYYRRQGLSTVRHGNGRDWWIIQGDTYSKKYTKYLLTPYSLEYYSVDSSEIIHGTGFDQMGFSPSGNYFTRGDLDTNDMTQYIYIYHFDRCTGSISFIDTLRYEFSYFVGHAFSPSERYLYGAQNDLLWQWDMEAPDIASSRILVDSNNYFTWPEWFAENFGALLNGPDGKVYLMSSNGSSHSMSTIHRPDEPAGRCEFRQNDIILPVWTSRSPPNLPNFRLGPFDGSPCDTLGLDNLPVARWRYELQDSTDHFKIRFTDLSYFRPETWHWDFDDGMTSDTSHPIHTFTEPGLFHVCLTVSNEFATDSMCRWIEIQDTISGVDEVGLPFFQMQPNPFTSQIDITHQENGYDLYRVMISDMTGREYVNMEMTIPGRLRLPSLPQGMYILNLSQDGIPVWSEKILKTE